MLIATVYGVGILIVWRHFTSLDAATWYARRCRCRLEAFTRPGMWYGYVSLPLFQFLLCRWSFRIAIWARFLFQVSRIELSLVPTHPDLLGGMGFLGETVRAFALIGLAHGALLAGQLVNRILFLGAELPDYKLAVLAVILFLLMIVLGPLLVFAPQLTAARQVGLREYGTLAERYVRQTSTPSGCGAARPPASR